MKPLTIELVSNFGFFNKKEIKDSMFVECLRWNNLVYLRTLKCGSEFFYRNFQEVAGWKKIRWQDINWDTDHVFSYIMDPIRRRHKGIAEFLIHHRLVNALFDNPDFAKLIKHVPFLDEHSAGMHTIYGNYVDKIDWIILSKDRNQGVKYTNLLLEHYNHPPINWNSEFVHTTDEYMKDIFDRLEQLWQSSDNELAVRNYYEREIRLLDQVNTRFNYAGKTWDQISWLRDGRLQPA